MAEINNNLQNITNLEFDVNYLFNNISEGRRTTHCYGGEVSGGSGGKETAQVYGTPEDRLCSQRLVCGLGRSIQ